MSKIYLCLGSNLGNKKKNLENALTMLGRPGIEILRKSSLYETEPVGLKLQPFFYNMCIEADTKLKPRELLRVVKEIEEKTGRKKGEKWGPRIIDIDILFYDNIILNIKELVIPHPEMQNRKFVLEPLSEIAGKFVHPGYNITVDDMCTQADFKEKVKRLEP